MKETTTIVTHTCDLCGSKAEKPDAQTYSITLGFRPIEACGVSISFYVFGVPTNESFVCGACQRKAVHKWLGE